MVIAVNIHMENTVLNGFGHFSEGPIGQDYDFLALAAKRSAWLASRATAGITGS